MENQTIFIIFRRIEKDINLQNIVDMTTPIKRSEHIVQLSKEHHFSLLFCWKLRMGLLKKIDPDRLIRYVMHFWNTHLLPHFEEELALFKYASSDSLVVQALDEHEIINNLIKSLHTISAEKKISTLTEIERKTNDHVRFEERVLFPHLEKLLSKDVLKQVEEELNALQPEPLQEDYEDYFWQ